MKRKVLILSTLSLEQSYHVPHNIDYVVYRKFLKIQQKYRKMT